MRILFVCVGNSCRSQMAEGIAKSHPMKRIGEGKDAAAMAKFLLTEESSWITGQIIGVDGGRSSI